MITCAMRGCATPAMLRLTTEVELLGYPHGVAVFAVASDACAEHEHYVRSLLSSIESNSYVRNPISEELY